MSAIPLVEARQRLPARPDSGPRGRECSEGRGMQMAGTSMKRRTVLACALAGAVLARRAVAQTGTRVFRIGWVSPQRETSLTPFVAAFRSALEELGLVEGRNLVIEFRYGNDVATSVPALVDELLRLPVDLIVAQGAAVTTINTMALKVPVVYVTSGDPVASGFADSLARPHSNMTGVTLMAIELNRKRLELLREIVPKLRRVAFIANPEHPGEDRERSFSIEAGKQLGLVVDFFQTRTRIELDAALAAMAADRPQAISVFSDGFAVQNRQTIIDAASRMRIPVAAAWPVFADSGALFSYGPRLSDSYRRLAYYVDRIQKGAKPADLPIQQPLTFEMVLNLKTA